MTAWPLVLTKSEAGEVLRCGTDGIDLLEQAGQLHGVELVPGAERVYLPRDVVAVVEDASGGV